jgi:hypothetical protein
MIKIKLDILKLLKEINQLERANLVTMILDSENESIKRNELSIIQKKELIEELSQKMKNIKIEKKNLENQEDKIEIENEIKIKSQLNLIFNELENNSLNVENSLKLVNSNKKKEELKLKEEKRRIKEDKIKNTILD